MRGIAGTRRVGHLGTLDPIATGVLPVMIGQATRLARFCDKSEKAYEAVVRFGFATSTYDRAGRTRAAGDRAAFTARTDRGLPRAHARRNRANAAAGFGQEDRWRPRLQAGAEELPVDLAPVQLFDLRTDAARLEGDRARLRVRCSAGTYVRTIAHELGMPLGCGAHVDVAGAHRAPDRFALDRPYARSTAGAQRRGQLWNGAASGRRSAAPVSGGICGRPSRRADPPGARFHCFALSGECGAEHVKAIGPDGRLVAIGRIALPHVYHPDAAAYFKTGSLRLQSENITEP